MQALDQGGSLRNPGRMGGPGLLQQSPQRGHSGAVPGTGWGDPPPSQMSPAALVWGCNHLHMPKLGF